MIVFICFLFGCEEELSAGQPPLVFISYQWDSQDEVSVLRDVLETNGFSCWMDVGQMGGGDRLYEKIYEGIKHAKVCGTPKNKKPTRLWVEAKRRIASLKKGTHLKSHLLLNNLKQQTLPKMFCGICLLQFSG